MPPLGFPCIFGRMAKKKKSKKRGPKPLAASEKRVPRWKVACNDAEARLIKRRAKDAGETIAAYLRKKGTGEL